MFRYMGLVLVRWYYFIITYLIYLGLREKIETSVVSIMDTAVLGLSHVTINVSLKAPGLEFSINTLKVVSNNNLSLNGLIDLSIQCAREIRMTQRFPRSPLFAKVYGKTFSFIKSQ